MNRTQNGPMKPPDVYEAIFVPAMFEPLAKITLQCAKLAAGERVLDLACGTGIVARRAAPLLGENGSVTAVDLRPGMIAKGRSLGSSGAPIRWLEGNATKLLLDDEAFDVVLCQQGLQFFEDKPAAVSEMRRVLDHRGRIVLAIWRGLDHLTLFKDLTAAEARHLETLGVTYEDVAAPFLFDKPDDIQRLLRDAGFKDIRLAEATVTAVFPSAERFVRDVEMAYASVMPLFVRSPAAFDAFVTAVDRDVRPAIERYRDGDGVRFTLATRIVTAHV
jgi:SAM-dependent methyltransferase